MRVYLVMLHSKSEHWFSSSQVLGSYRTYAEAHSMVVRKLASIYEGNPDVVLDCHTEYLWVGPYQKIEIVPVTI